MLVLCSIFISHLPTHLQIYLEGLLNPRHGLLKPQESVLEILAVGDRNKAKLVLLIHPQHKVGVVIHKHSLIVSKRRSIEPIMFN